METKLGFGMENGQLYVLYVAWIIASLARHLIYEEESGFISYEI